MAMSSLRESLPLVAATTLATILITSQIKPIARPVKTIFSRFYLQCFVLSGKNATAEGSDGSSSSSSSESNNTTVVTALNTYPVKSLRAVPCEEAVLDARGFVGDRRYMLVTAAPLPLWGSFGPNDATHRFLTQRQCPILARVVVSVHDDGTMTLSSDVLPKEIFRISTGPAADAPIYKSTLWGDLVTVQDMSDVAATFMQKIVAADAEIPEELKKGVRMVMQSVQDSRTANDKFVPATARTLTGMNPRVSLADGFPLLIASEASLAELNRRLKEKGKDPLPMARFRPSIVIQGTVPFAEDRMKVIQIGGTILHVVSGCPRCKESCTDQTAGIVTKEPLETLREFRQMNSNCPEGLYFAVNAIAAPGSEGQTIRVGDSVKVLQWGEPVWGDP